jgi:hypothetical protein
MFLDLITLPLRVAALTTRVGVHVAVDALATVADRLAVPRPEPLATRRSVWGVEFVSVPAQTPPAEPDAGAQDGAATSVHVDEPWDGYGGMNAHDVIHRLTAASAEEAVAVELYERSHGKRKTVLAAADRRLRRRPAPEARHEALKAA